MAALRRQQADVRKLMRASYEVVVDEASAARGTLELLVKNFRGPAGTPYEGGVWMVFVHLPAEYPIKSPSIGFRTRIFHPNIDERSGSVCLDVINQSWSPMYDLINVFEVFLPQLLSYGNATDPLNGEAAALMLREPARYTARVREYVTRFATAGAAGATAAAPPLPAASGGGGGGGSSSGSVASPLLRAGSSSGGGSTPASLAATTRAAEVDDDDVEVGSVPSDISDLSDL